eukprot:scaffold547_cov99-Isochrysis_galbana.AAC.1
MGTLISWADASCDRAKWRMRWAVRERQLRCSCVMASHAALSSTSRVNTSLSPGCSSPNCSAYRRRATSPSARIASTMGSAVARALGSTGSRRIAGTSSGRSRFRGVASAAICPRSAWDSLEDVARGNSPRLSAGPCRAAGPRAGPILLFIRDVALIIACVAR